MGKFLSMRCSHLLEIGVHVSLCVIRSDKSDSPGHVTFSFLIQSRLSRARINPPNSIIPDAIGKPRCPSKGDHLQAGCTLMPNRFRGVFHLSGPAAAMAGHVPRHKGDPRQTGHISNRNLLRFPVSLNGWDFNVSLGGRSACSTPSLVPFVEERVEVLGA
ncbi:hypothetical protein NPIL_270571 [Nephila pilipes]|uniref:Uncharacterized protein n=1 Tax=Nephila pilipes TaxID=299642 RepID=A0A8X6PZ72_NEPPI|nr:hypothetical protein NPIL_497771 [Nephila pilipes]GFT91133.1 hypothetical protein NPIL_270571 [Nephila pilipes]